MKFLTVKDVAERLNVSVFTVRSLIRAGKIPVIKLGRRTVRIPETWLEELVQLKPEHKLSQTGADLK